MTWSKDGSAEKNPSQPVNTSKCSPLWLSMCVQVPEAFCRRKIHFAPSSTQLRRGAFPLKIGLHKGLFNCRCDPVMVNNRVQSSIPIKSRGGGCSVHRWPTIRPRNSFDGKGIGGLVCLIFVYEFDVKLRLYDVLLPQKTRTQSVLQDNSPVLLTGAPQLRGITLAAGGENKVTDGERSDTLA
jgi:hypothetical protein